MLISPIQIIVCGIPHGSKFGPVWFLLQIIDMPDSSSKTLFRKFGQLIDSLKTDSEDDKSVTG